MGWIVNRFDALPPPTWPRLRALLDGHTPADIIDLSIGAPKHPFPDWVGDVMMQEMQGFNRYPNNAGMPVLLQAIRDWIERRYQVCLDADTQIMALNGTREGLYNAVMALCPDTSNILIPNPFYQVYSMAALSVGARPVYLPATQETGFLPDLDAIDAQTLNTTSVMYLCTPSNPQGAVADRTYWARAVELAEKYDFKIFADECYSEIYRNAPPPGGLEAGGDPERMVVFHSLSKRSNLPGLRSGFVASGPQNIAKMKTLRAYAGSPLPDPIQVVSAKVWADETHVVANRQLYCDKFMAADHIFADIEGYQSPNAGFFLWLPVDDGEQAALKLWRKTGVRVLPGAYLGQTVNGENPGQNYIRVALVAPKDETQRGLSRLHDCLYKK